MTLTGGRRLGPYEILGPIGTGGMGEVYRALDPRLHRDVAIKVLPEGFVSDADRLARFQREARLLASLSHPGIAVIHEVGDEPSGEEAPLRYIVMGSSRERRSPTGSRAVLCASRRRSTSLARSPTPSPPPTTAASSTATSSRRT